ncbi:S-adenosyl-L-methionine-dependent methyltransferase [Xylariales sp. PMI_506]|nr:S-adenosyl-L-methionine-dependent methyltransferase [Xylariales sp. PMI_506]
MAHLTPDAASESDVDMTGFQDFRRDSAISALSWQSRSTLTESVSTAVYDFVEENGRTYHSYKAGRYLLPNDRAEQDRAELDHHLFNLTLKNKLYLSPVGRLRHVLDIGTGTGLWALELAFTHPAAQVIGTDLSPIQPSRIPTNLQFEIDDAEDPWVYRHKFDLIHGRSHLFSFQSPEKVIANAAAALESHGWLEFQDFVFPFFCDDGSWEGTYLQKWTNVVKECWIRSGRRHYVEEYAQLFRDVGLTNVTERLFIWPVNPWPPGIRNGHQRELGYWTRRTLLTGLEAMSIALMTRFGGMTRDEVLQLVQHAKADLWNTNYHVYIRMVVTMGQKA